LNPGPTAPESSTLITRLPRASCQYSRQRMSGSKGLTDTCGCERLSPPGALETVEYTGVVLHCSVAVVFWRASSVWSQCMVCSHSVTVTASVDSRATVDRARRRTLCTTRGVGRHVEHVTNSVGRRRHVEFDVLCTQCFIIDALSVFVHAQGSPVA